QTDVPRPDTPPVIATVGGVLMQDPYSALAERLRKADGLLPIHDECREPGTGTAGSQRLQTQVVLRAFDQILVFGPAFAFVEQHEVVRLRGAFGDAFDDQRPGVRLAGFRWQQALDDKGQFHGCSFGGKRGRPLPYLRREGPEGWPGSGALTKRGPPGWGLGASHRQRSQTITLIR